MFLAIFIEAVWSDKVTEGMKGVIWHHPVSLILQGYVSKQCYQTLSILV